MATCSASYPGVKVINAARLDSNKRGANCRRLGAWNLIGGGKGGVRDNDPGDWKYSPEWIGTQGGSWGRDAGVIVFQEASTVGNGLVTVTAHDASIVDSELSAKRQGPQEWRVLRFNEITRQSVNRVQLNSYETSRSIAIQPSCLAFEYLKTMAAAGWLCDFHMLQPLNLCFIGAGGCTLPAFFSSLYKGAKVEAVEVDPVVIKAAVDFMGIRPSDCKILKEDGGEYMEKCWKSGHKLDIVFVDAFNGVDEVPSSLSDPSGKFLQTLPQVLHPETGAVIINVHGGKISSAYDFLSFLGPDPGFDESSVAGKSVWHLIHSFSDALLKGNKKGCCFSLSTIHQDNIIIVISRELPMSSTPETLRQAFKDVCENNPCSLPFDPFPRLTRGLTVW